VFTLTQGVVISAGTHWSLKSAGSCRSGFKFRQLAGVIQTRRHIGCRKVGIPLDGRSVAPCRSSPG